MFCTGKEQLTCNSEKMGCEGCFYFNDENNKKVNDEIKMENLIEELTKVNPANLSEEGLKLFNKINEIIDRNEELEKLSENIKIFRDNNLSSEIDYVIALKSNFMNYLQTDYIPKSKVRKKIEELEKEIEEKQENCLDFTLMHEHEIDTNGIITVLQELLQEGDK